jgi:hypothetical protein
MTIADKLNLISGRMVERYELEFLTTKLAVPAAISEGCGSSQAGKSGVSSST